MSPKQFGVQQFFWFKKVWVKQNFWPNKILIQGLQKNRVQKVWVCNSWDIRNMDKCRQDTCFLFPWQLESVKDGSRYLLLKSGENQISNSWYIPDMDKCHMNKCCMDKCHCDTWNLFKMIQGAYLSSLVKSGNNSWDKTWSSVSNSSLGNTFALCQFRKLKVQKLCFHPPNIVLGLKKNESKNHFGSERKFSTEKNLGPKKILV